LKLFHNYKSLWGCNNPSGKLKEIKSVLKTYLKGHNITYDNIGNMYIGDFSKEKPCIVAHLDSVHQSTGKLYSNKGMIFSSNGIGGDDKCGIVACLEVLKQCDVNILFTVNEEIGGIGANNIDKDKLKNVMYFIEADRRGSRDLITNLVYYLDKSVSQDFLDVLNPYISAFGFMETSGCYTDLTDILPAVKKCGFNLSAGYYNPHTKKEYVILSELENTINFIVSICTNIRKTFDLPEYTLSIEDDYFPEELLIGDLSTINTIEELREYIEIFYPNKNFERLLDLAYELGCRDTECNIHQEYKNKDYFYNSKY